MNWNDSLRDRKRPELLVRAARFGAAELLRRGPARRRRSPPNLPSLLDEEDALNIERVERTAGYSASRHVHILITLLWAAQTGMRSADA
jgi:hypothetical protein